MLALVTACASAPAETANGPTSGSNTGTSPAPSAGVEPSGTLPTIFVQGDLAIPADTLQDWVTYGDQIVVATVTGDRVLNEERRQADVGTELSGRIAEFGDISVLFRRDGTADLPAPLHLLVHGQVKTDGGWRRVAALGAPRIEPGGRYLLCITYRPDRADMGDGRMQLIGAMPAEGGVAGDGEWTGRVNDSDLSAVQTKLLGLDLKTVASELAETAPDKFAFPYFDLPPVERWARAQEDREASSQPSPRPS